MHTATFKDTWFGAVPMVLTSFKTSRAGSKVVRYRWTLAPGTEACVTTGFVPSGFASIERAVTAACAHALFSNVA